MASYAHKEKVAIRNKDFIKDLGSWKATMQLGCAMAEQHLVTVPSVQSWQLLLNYILRQICSTSEKYRLLPKVTQ